MAFYRYIDSTEAKDLIVDFTGANTGTVIVDDWCEYKVGEVIKSWIHYQDTTKWEPCADPRQSRTNRMLKALNDT